MVGHEAIGSYSILTRLAVSTLTTTNKTTLTVTNYLPNKHSLTNYQLQTINQSFSFPHKVMFLEG